MPLLQYFGWVGGVLLTTLLAANWCLSQPVAPAPDDIPLDRKINIRIHTDKKWPERVVFDTTRSSLAPETAVASDMNAEPGETHARPERRQLEAFAQMSVISVRPCLRLPCADRARERQDSPSDKSSARPSTTAHNGFTVPNRSHKLPGRS